MQLTDPPITKDDADEYLRRDLARFYASAIALCPGLAGDGRRAGAILDFVYNLGPQRLKISTLRARINAGNWSAARSEIMRWDKGRDPKTGILRPLPGLVKRRLAESALL